MSLALNSRWVEWTELEERSVETGAEVIDEFRKVIIIYRRYFNIMYVYPPSVELYFKQVPQEGRSRRFQLFHPPDLLLLRFS